MNSHVPTVASGLRQSDMYDMSGDVGDVCVVLYTPWDMQAACESQVGCLYSVILKKVSFVCNFEYSFKYSDPFDKSNELSFCF